MLDRVIKFDKLSPDVWTYVHTYRLTPALSFFNQSFICTCCE